jgi:hypothetical protein
VAARDAELPVADLLDQLRSPTLHAWQRHPLPRCHGRAPPPARRAGRRGGRRPRPTHRRPRNRVRAGPHRSPAGGRRHGLVLGGRPGRTFRQRVTRRPPRRPDATRRPSPTSRAATQCTNPSLTRR